jgi:hypothetical protein
MANELLTAKMIFIEMLYEKDEGDSDFDNEINVLSWWWRV